MKCGRKPINLAGQKFGRWKVIERAGASKSGSPIWRWVCDCGTTGLVTSDSLRRNGTQSCGCLLREVMSARMKELHARGAFQTHGMTGCPEYYSYVGAKGRCTNPHSQAWPWYGGRGIEFRFESFEQFFAELGPRPAGMTLDRKDTNGHYEPGNVRWATRSEQTKNQRPWSAERLARHRQQKSLQPRDDGGKFCVTASVPAVLILLP
jgi:hypothetical protein